MFPGAHMCISLTYLYVSVSQGIHVNRITLYIHVWTMKHTCTLTSLPNVYVQHNLYTLLHTPDYPRTNIYTWDEGTNTCVCLSLYICWILLSVYACTLEQYVIYIAICVFVCVCVFIHGYPGVFVYWTPLRMHVFCAECICITCPYTHTPCSLPL
jgi:hypothetical protein